jgi:hypothetical protein
MRPVTDALVVTNARVMGLSSGVGFKFKARFDEITETAYDPYGKTVRIATSNGSAMTFKNVAAEDVAAVQGYVEQGRSQPLPESVDVALRQASEESGLPDGPDDELRRFGRKLIQDSFAMRSIRIYEKGYVRVALPMMGSNAKFEKLISIEATSDVSKKSAVGRGVGFLASGGLTVLGSNKRGDVYLTIRTEDTVHVLHEDPPTALNLRTVKRLESVGRSVIQQPDEDPSAQAPAASEPRSAADRLRELQSLRDEGLISDDEHRAQRDRLLGSL